MLTDTMTWAEFWDAWSFFRPAALTGALLGGSLGWLGVYVVLRRLVFLSAAISQAAGLGVALSFLAAGVLTGAAATTLGQPLVGAALLTGGVVLWSLRERPGGLSRDGRLGLAYLLGAAGTLVVGTFVREDLHDIDSLLFGSAVAVLPEDFRLVIGLTMGLGGLHLWWWRGFAAASFDADGARVRGIPVRLLDIALFASLALSLSVATRVVGALPAFAFTVLPAVAALRLARNIPVALCIAAAVGVFVGFGGYVLSALWGPPVGATQAILGIGVVAVADLLRRALRLLTPTRRAATAVG